MGKRKKEGRKEDGKEGSMSREGDKGGMEKKSTSCTVTHVEAVTSRPPYFNSSLTFPSIDSWSCVWKEINQSVSSSLTYQRTIHSYQD